MGAWARPEEGQGQQAAHLAQSTDKGPHGGLGAALGHHRPGEEKDWCLDKDRFQGLWVSESLSASPSILSAQGIHTTHPPLPPITQSGVIHLLVSCPLRSLPNWDPLTATVGIQTPGMEPGDSPGQGSQPLHGATCHHPQVPTESICGCHIQPSKSQPLGRYPILWVPGSGSWETCPSEQEQAYRSPGKVCLCSCVLAWGCSCGATHILHLSQPNSLTQ